MTNNHTDLTSCIDQFIKEKQQISSGLQQPNTIKKKELELCLEDYADNNEIEYQKKSEPTKTIYTFSLEGQDVQVEFFYRYSNYYTRHSITIK
jgi:hypothetical protein